MQELRYCPAFSSKGFGFVVVELQHVQVWVPDKDGRPGTPRFDWSLIDKNPGSKGLPPVPKRWVVEHTNAWSRRSRRNSKDYERSPESAAAMIQLSHLHLMVRQLAPAA